MKRTNVHLTEQQLEALSNLLELTGLPVAEHIRRAIDEYLAKFEKTEAGLQK